MGRPCTISTARSNWASIKSCDITRSCSRLCNPRCRPVTGLSMNPVVYIGDSFHIQAGFEPTLSAATMMSIRRKKSRGIHVKSYMHVPNSVCEQCRLGRQFPMRLVYQVGRHTVFLRVRMSFATKECFRRRRKEVETRDVSLIMPTDTSPFVRTARWIEGIGRKLMNPD